MSSVTDDMTEPRFRDFIRNHASNRMRLTARWIFPVHQKPIPNGIVEVQNGIITDVSSSTTSRTDSTVFDLGQVALIPGLVNPHAHCEFSDLDTPFTPSNPFTDWIARLMAYRRARTTSTEQLVARGLEECWQTGAAIVGEIATTDWPLTNWDQAGTVVAFRECIAPTPERVAGQLQLAAQHLDQCHSANTRTGAAPQHLIGALSPHAPYTVLPELFEKLIELARSRDVPLAMHLAETTAELTYLREQAGPFRDLLERLGIWHSDWHPPKRRPLDFLQALALLPHALAIHGNYLDDDEVSFLSRHPQVAVVYCPRTHHYFNHPPHRWLELIEAGASVAIGTDGRSSNPDYSLWNELRFLDQQTDGRHRPLLLSLGTEMGARALGLERSHGRIEIGYAAALSVLTLANDDNSDPWPALFRATSCRRLI